jgi:CMP-N,N'-diacetyllegionaminic acid synthase
MRFVFDLDGTLCHTRKVNGKWDYEGALPRYAMIEKLNYLHDKGHHIIICTARGSITGDNWENITKRQLKGWDVNYDELIFGKPAADVYIDDRTITPEFMLNNWTLVDGMIGNYI